jgi:hypothetical protein
MVSDEYDIARLAGIYKALHHTSAPRRKTARGMADITLKIAYDLLLRWGPFLPATWAADGAPSKQLNGRRIP